MPIVLHCRMTKSYFRLCAYIFSKKWFLQFLFLEFCIKTFQRSLCKNLSSAASDSSKFLLHNTRESDRFLLTFKEPIFTRYRNQSINLLCHGFQYQRSICHLWVNIGLFPEISLFIKTLAEPLQVAIYKTRLKRRSNMLFSTPHSLIMSMTFALHRKKKTFELRLNTV